MASGAHATEKPSTREEYLQSLGIATFEHAFKDIYLPSVVNVPRDLMHVELEGTLKSHLKGVLYMAMRKLRWFSLKQFNDALKRWPFPVGKRPPELPEIPKGEELHCDCDPHMGALTGVCVFHCIQALKVANQAQRPLFDGLRARCCTSSQLVGILSVV